MSRRCHHGSPRHARPGRVPRRPGLPESAADASPVSRAPADLLVGPGSPSPDEIDAADDASPAEEERDTEVGHRPTPGVLAARERDEPGVPAEPDRVAAPRARDLQPPRFAAPGRAMPVPHDRPFGHRPGVAPPSLRPGNGAPPIEPEGEPDPGTAERGATAPQLRRFIKSRAYVPMHELRRRFAINGGDDDVTPVDLDANRVYVGLPEREGRLLGELLRGGDIGYELSMDPISPIVVGVYPMRPVSRG